MIVFLDVITLDSVIRRENNQNHWKMTNFNI